MLKQASSKTKILLTLTIEQKELLSKIATSKGLSLSAYLRYKALEDVDVVSMENVSNTNSSLKNIQKYLEKPVNLPKKYKEYTDFRNFHKHNYQK